MCKQSDFRAPRVLTVFESPGVSSRELAKRFQMILGTPRLRPKALSPNSATGPPNTATVARASSYTMYLAEATGADDDARTPSTRRMASERTAALDMDMPSLGANSVGGLP